MAKYRCKENHPTVQKLNKLWDYMEELGLTIEFNYRTVVKDEDRPEEFYLEDLEEHPSSHMVSFLPYSLETKLVFEKDDDENE